MVQGEPEIDNKSISNVQNVSDMDEDAQQDYQRVMFDMEQKRQGKPTIKEMVRLSCFLYTKLDIGAQFHQAVFKHTILLSKFLG